jgi:hypothetical protein
MNNQFINTRPIKKWAVVCFGDASRSEQIRQNAVATARQLMEVASRLGMRFQSEPLILVINFHELKDCFLEIARVYCADICLCILPTKDSALYSMIKQEADLNLGLVTQCAEARKIDGRKAAYLSNLCLKVILISVLII